MFSERLGRARSLMREQGVDVMLLSTGPDLPYFCGYEAMPLERLTMLVVPLEGEATLVVPRLEALRVAEGPDVFVMRVWDEAEDPVAIVVDLMGAAAVAAVGDHMWSRFLVELLASAPSPVEWRRASDITALIRSVKDADEIERLRAAGAGVDRVAAELQRGGIDLVGRTEAEVSAELGARMLAEGHSRVNFAVVAAGANAASPHHEPSDRTIMGNEVVLCDFGGAVVGPDGVGYCSDITRCVYTGDPPAEFRELYAVLFEAQAAAVAAATAGTAAEAVDRAARSIIDAAGFGDRFVHRTGHGIGVEEHEEPYIVAGNDTELVAGNTFSIEPGIYIPDCWGARIEDIVVATDTGPELLNNADRRLVAVA